jgi:Zn-dependent protease
LSQEQLVSIVIVIAIMLLVGFPVHEFAHAWAAYRLGDGTAKMFGRLTLNPIAHFDPVGGVLLALSFLVSQGSFAFGWAKPTPVNPMNLAGGRRGEAMVAAAGPLSNLLLATIGAIPLRFLVMNPDLISSVPDLLILVLDSFVRINIILMVFNLIPIPPLDGSKVLFAALDRQTEYRIRPILEQYGFLIVIALFFFPPGNSIGGRILVPIINGIYGFLVGI